MIHLSIGVLDSFSHSIRTASATGLRSTNVDSGGDDAEDSLSNSREAFKWSHKEELLRLTS